MFRLGNPFKLLSKKRSFYEGGKKTLANRDFWNANNPFEETASVDRDTLRARARWLHENNPIMSNIDKAIINNVIGKGIGLQSKTGNKKIDDLIEKRFKAWSHRCDITNRLSFADIQRIILETRMVDGEIFIYKKITDDGLKLQLIEADSLDSFKGTNGITLDANGIPKTYHFKVENKSIDVPSEYIINYCKIERATQFRGISEYKQAILDIKNFSAYQSATVKNARANAEIAYTIESERDSGVFGHGQTENREEIQEINGLMVYYLRQGEKATKHKNDMGSGYSDFVTTTVRMISTARNISYELAFRDYSRVNFASARASLIQDNKRFDYEQEHLTNYLLNDIFATWIEVDVMRGKLELNLTKCLKDKEQFIAPRWSYPKREWVNPQQDMKAIEKEIELNLTTMTDLAHERGLDFEEVLATKQKEQELLTKYQLQNKEGLNA